MTNSTPNYRIADFETAAPPRQRRVLNGDIDAAERA